MAKILYGIHGTGHGHATRGLILARAMPWHEFLFVANDDAPKVLEPEFKTVRLPNLGTVFRNYRVDLGATVRRAIPVLMNRKKYIREAVRIIEHFQPDVCMADLEYFVPQAAKITGVPCLALDHQHIITCARHQIPADMRYDMWLQGLTPRWLFTPCQANLIISFYAPLIKPCWNAFVAPPILRQSTLSMAPEDGSHILVYQSNSTDKRLMEFLKTATTREAHVFGYINEERRDGNIFFHKRDEKRFQDILGSCCYVIQGGSHTLMSEALYLGKPVLSLPLLAMVEQRLNSFYLEKLGYGRQARIAELNKTFLGNFEKKLPEYKNAIASRNFLGNDFVFDVVNKFANTKVLPNFRVREKNEKNLANYPAER